MKSTIKIALHGSDGPMILASVSTDTSDLRDDVMNKFFRSLEGSFTNLDNTQEKSYLCFVEGFGREREPDAYIHTIHPIRPGEEDKYINRLQTSQIKRIIPLAFQVLSNEDARDVLTQCPTQLTESISKLNEDRLPSSFQIDTLVSTDTIFDGQVVAVRFTAGKVYYDVLDKLTGKVMRDVDSCVISAESDIKLPVAF